MAKNKKINSAQKAALQEKIVAGKVSEILLKNSNPDVIATKIAKFVTKDLGQNINTTYSASNTPFSSPNSASPQVSVVPTASSGSSLTSPSAWPSPKLWYQQGDEVAKKVYNEYLNALNQYMNCPPEQFEHKMEEAGKMNALVQSMVQGLSIGLEGAEDIQRRARVGDTAAPIEMRVVKNTMEKMLKTIWVHNTAAASAKMAGLEVKLLESQMVSRISKAIGVPLTDYGIQLQSADDADTIWMAEPEMPPEVQGLQEEDVMAPETMEETPMTEGEEEITPEEEIVAPEDEEVPLDDDVLRDENGNVIGEDVPTDTEVDNLEETPIEETEDIAEDETAPLEEMAESAPEEGEVLDEEVADEEGAIPTDEELADEGEVPEEETIEEFPEDDAPIEEEEIEEDALPEETADEFPEDTEPVDEEGFIAEDEEEVPEEDVEDQEVEEEEPIEEETVDEELPVEEEVVEEEPEEEESLYCIMCDQYVTPDEIAACEEENCPFRNVVGNAVEDVTTEEVPVEEDVEEKHFVLLDQEDHSDHKVYSFTVKDFTGVEGEYCLDCGCATSYAFKQKEWTSGDARKWVQKQNKVVKLKEKSSEEIIQESLDKIPDSVFKELVEDRKTPNESELVTKEFDGIEIDKDVLKEVLDEVFNPISNRLKALEA